MDRRTLEFDIALLTIRVLLLWLTCVYIIWVVVEIVLRVTEKSKGLHDSHSKMHDKRGVTKRN